MNDRILRYKYVPLTESSLNILREGTIKFTKPSEFNDPFDCNPDYDPMAYADFLLRNKSLLKRAGDAMHLSPAQRLQNRSKMAKRIENSIKNDNFPNGFVDDVGILSLSRDPLNLLMWSHYASNHTGFVVELSIPQSASITSDESDTLFLDCLFPLPVEYSPEKPIINPFDHRDLNASKQFLVKSTDWIYEKEERVIDFLRGPGVHPFKQKEILKSVIAGIKMSDEDYERLECEVIKVNDRIGANISIYKAKPCKGKFSIYIPDRWDLSSHSECC